MMCTVSYTADSGDPRENQVWKKCHAMLATVSGEMNISSWMTVGQPCSLAEFIKQVASLATSKFNANIVAISGYTVG